MPCTVAANDVVIRGQQRRSTRLDGDPAMEAALEAAVTVDGCVLITTVSFLFSTVLV